MATRGIRGAQESGVLDAIVRCLAEGEPLVATGSGDDDLVDPDIRQICQYWIGTDRVLVPPGSSYGRSGAGFPASRVLPSLRHEVSTWRIIRASACC